MTIKDFIIKQSIFSETQCNFKICEADGTLVTLTIENWNKYKDVEFFEWKLEDLTSGHYITFCS